MIGGYDIIIESDCGPELSLDLVCSAATRVWPDCVVEDAATGTPLYKDEFGYKMDGIVEIMVYKNRDCQKLWELKGATAETEDTMIHALYHNDALTIVVGNPMHPESKAIVDGVQKLLLSGSRVLHFK